MATFNIKHSNQSIIDYMKEKITVEYNGTVEDIDGGIKVECPDESLKDISDAFSRAKRNTTVAGWAKSATKFIGRQTNTVKDVGIGAVGLSAKGLFGAVKKTAELAMGATAVIVNEGKEAFAEAKVSDELRNLKKSFGASNDAEEGIEMVVTTPEATEGGEA